MRIDKPTKLDGCTLRPATPQEAAVLRVLARARGMRELSEVAAAAAGPAAPLALREQMTAASRSLVAQGALSAARMVLGGRECEAVSLPGREQPEPGSDAVILREQWADGSFTVSLNETGGSLDGGPAAEPQPRPQPTPPRRPPTAAELFGGEGGDPTAGVLARRYFGEPRSRNRAELVDEQVDTMFGDGPPSVAGLTHDLFPAE